MGLLFFSHPGGKVCVGMGSAGFLGQVGCKERAGKNISKMLLSLVSAFAGEKKLHSAVQNGTVQFFFEEKKNEFGSDSKMGYDKES